MKTETNKFYAAVNLEGPALGFGTSPHAATEMAKQHLDSGTVTGLSVVEINNEAYEQLRNGDPDAWSNGIYEILYVVD